MGLVLDCFWWVGRWWVAVVSRRIGGGPLGGFRPVCLLAVCGLGWRCLCGEAFEDVGCDGGCCGGEEGEGGLCVFDGGVVLLAVAGVPAEREAGVLVGLVFEDEESEVERVGEGELAEFVGCGPGLWEGAALDRSAEDGVRVAL
jgi:hypothetical protein